MFLVLRQYFCSGCNFVGFHVQLVLCLAVIFQQGGAAGIGFRDLTLPFRPWVSFVVAVVFRS